MHRGCIAAFFASLLMFMLTLPALAPFFFRVFRSLIVCTAVAVVAIGAVAATDEDVSFSARVASETNHFSPNWPSTQLKGSSVPVQAAKVGYLIDKTGKLDIMDVLGRKDFASYSPYQTFSLGKDGAAWLRLRLEVPIDNKQATRGSDLTPWILEIPAPLLDDVQLYQMGPDQRLMPTQKAGDLLANAQWSFPANVTAFRLNLYAGDGSDVWLRVKYPIATQLPIFLKTERQYLYDSRAYFWIMGVVFGALLFLILYVGVMVITFKDMAHLAFGLYLGTSLATLFAYSGINGYLGFDQAAAWVDVSTGFWQLLSAAAALFFTGTVLQAPARAPRLAWGMRGLGVFALVVVPLYIWLDRASIGASLVFIVLSATYVFNFIMALIAWRAGDSAGRLIAIFYGLLLLNLLMVVAGRFEWVAFFWYQQTPISIVMVVMMPLILAGMNFNMRHQLAMQIRAQGMRSHDALTDTLNEPFFLARLRTIMNSPRKRKGAALVVIDVSNLPYMRQGFAPEVIEKTLLRAVIKIKRVFGDMDAIGRIGHSRLAVLMEATDRERIGKLAVELIASGLMPSKNIKQDITIVFHFAVAMLGDYAGETDSALPQLQALCDKMSPRTQRPIRYLTASAQNPSNGTQQSEGEAAAPSSTSFMPSKINLPTEPRHSAEAGDRASDRASAASPPDQNSHHAIHSIPEGLQTIPPAASTLPPGSPSSGQPSSGAAPSSSFHQ